VTLILECDCTFIFTVLLLLVEGLEVPAALNFNIVVVNRCRAVRRIATVLWLTVVGLSMWDGWYGRAVCMCGVWAKFGNHLWTGVGII